MYPLPRTHNVRDVAVTMSWKKRGKLTRAPDASLDGFAVCGANVERTIVGNILIRESRDISFCAVRSAADYGFRGRDSELFYLDF